MRIRVRASACSVAAAELFRSCGYHPGVRFSPPQLIMILLSTLLPVAAIGYSLIYLLFGGGLVGAVVIYFVAKMFGG